MEVRDQRSINFAMSGDWFQSFTASSIGDHISLLTNTL